MHTDSGMSDNNRYFITTPIFYPNGAPHIGHAYTMIATDALARFRRLDGMDVRFLSGTDEHGQKIADTAAASGVQPIELCDKHVAMFKALQPAPHPTGPHPDPTDPKPHP